MKALALKKGEKVPKNTLEERCNPRLGFLSLKALEEP
jgi:hypothetical protein